MSREFSINRGSCRNASALTPLLIVETNVVALLIIEEPVVPLITEPAAAGHGGSDAAFWGLPLLGHSLPLGQGLACIT